MSRWRLLPGFLMLSVLAAGLFGLLHDQISVTVSPEYYTEFKFQQFHLTGLDAPLRVKAGLVGVFASWWMGLPLGLAAFAGAWHRPTLLSMRRAMLGALPIMMGVTMMVSLAGLAWGLWHVTALPREQWPHWFLPATVKDARAFVAVGCMHAAAYAGGILAVPAAWWWQRRSG